MKNRLVCFTFALLIALSASATLWTGGGAQFPDGSYVWTNKTNWGGNAWPLNSGGIAEFPANCEVTVNLDGVFTQNNGVWGQIKQLSVPASSHVTFVGNARGTNSYMQVNNATALHRLTLAKGARIKTGSAFPASASLMVTNGAMLELNNGYTVNAGVHIDVMDGSIIQAGIGTMKNQAILRVDNSFMGGTIGTLQGGLVSLENGSAGVLSTITPGTNGTFRLTGGSSARVTGTLYTYQTGGHFELSGRSTLTATTYFKTGLGTTFDIDDSTVVSETQGLILCNGSGDKGGDTFTFRGDNPQLIIKNGLSIQNVSSVGNNGVILNFEVPERGFKDAPFCHTYTGSKTFGNPTNIKPNGVNEKFIHVNLLASSPALDPDYAYATLSKLLFTAGGLQNTAFFDCQVEGADNQATFAFTTSDGETETSTAANVRYVTARMENGVGGKPLAVRGVEESSGVASYSTLSVNRRAFTFTSAVTALADAPLETYAVLYEGESSSLLVPVATNAITETGNFLMTWTGPVFLKTYYFRVALETRTAGGAVTHVEWSDTRSAATKDTTNYTWQDVDGDWTGDWGDDAHWSDNHGGDCLGHPASKDANVYIPGGHDIVINFDAPYTIGWFYANADDTRLTLKAPAGLRDTNKFVVYGDNGSNMSTFKGANSAFVLDGCNVDLRWTNFKLGHHSSLVLTNAAYTTKLRQVFVSEEGAAGTWFRVVDGSYANLTFARPGIVLGYSTGSDPCGIVIDNATVESGQLKLHSAANAVSRGSLTFRGTNAVLSVSTQENNNNIFSSATAANKHRFIFEVPDGGFAAPPLRCPSASGNQAFSLYGETAQLSVVFEVADGSVAYGVKKKKDSDLSLMTSVCGINKDCVSFAPLKHPRRGNTFLYGTATTDPYGWTPVADFTGTAKSIGLHVCPPPCTVIMLR